MAKIEATKEIQDKLFEIIGLSKSTGKIKKGSNEVTKSLERGTAKLVIIAKDVSPAEITMHLPLLCEEKKIKCYEVPSKADLGASCGMELATVAIAIIQEGEAKKILDELA